MKAWKYSNVLWKQGVKVCYLFLNIHIRDKHISFQNYMYSIVCTVLEGTNNPPNTHCLHFTISEFPDTLVFWKACYTDVVNKPYEASLLSQQLFQTSTTCTACAFTVWWLHRPQRQQGRSSVQRHWSSILVEYKQKIVASAESVLLL